MNAEIIQAEHDRLGYTAGWRFMTAPERNLSTSTLAVIGLNPGGSRPHGPTWSQEDGNAYFIESWGGQAKGADPLQRQVRRMLEMLAVRDPHQVFTAQFTPFRSPSWSDLDRRAEAIAFSEMLWRWALPQSPARLFICIGKGVSAPRIASLLGAAPEPPSPAGWGDQTIERYRTPDGRRVIGLPHLGRFKLFGRAQSETAFRRALED